VAPEAARAEPGRIVLAGIDEAGLGPLLGSLSIGYAFLEAPADGAEPWKCLRGLVARRPGRRARMVVADSKLVFQRTPQGARRLETTVLGFRAQRGGPEAPAGVERDPHGFLFDALAPPPLWRALPWGAELPALPCDTDPDSLELTSALLARRLERAGIAVLDAGVRLVPAGELNESFARTANKAVSVWEKVREVLRHAWAWRTRAPVRATVDMLGGRRHYGSLLGMAFPEARVTLVGETRGSSAYAIEARADGGRMDLEFRVGADRRVFEVALASCFAKYARELEMRALNAHFGRLQPELTPTAGYRGDGRRWLNEASEALARSGIAPELLVRSR